MVEESKKALNRQERYRVSYVNHSIPSVVTAAALCQAWVHVINEGALDWIRKPVDGNSINLVLWVNNSAARAFDLPKEWVAPGESAIIPVEFVSPEIPGPFVIKFDMMHNNVAFFEAHGADILMVRPEAVASEDRLIPDESLRSIAEKIPVYAAYFNNFRIPETVRPGERFGIWLNIENQGTLTWETDPARGRQVRVVMRIDEDIRASSDLPQVVRPFEYADIHMAAPAPLIPGRHQLKIDLVHEGVTFFSNCGSQMLGLEIEVKNGRQSSGSLLYETALQRDSWFYQPSFGIAFGADGSRYPLFVKQAKGCYIWDTEGNRYIDYTMGWGSALLGYAYHPIQKAIRKVLDCGAILPLPHPIEMEVARKLCEDIPCAEMVAFGKNGSDVCTLAIRMARLYTGRRKVITCGYHGWQDWFVEGFGFEFSGVPSRGESLTSSFIFNCQEDFIAKFEANRAELAAVILEPAGASQPGQTPAEDVDRAFIRMVADKTREAGGLLIFDEIITGFRYPGGGVQKATGVIPDLACFGKALGAGMPISALVGRKDILSSCMPRAFYGPTYKGEIYSLAAASAALEIYRRKPVAANVWDFGVRIKEHVNRFCREAGIKAKMTGAPFRFGLAFDEPDPSRLKLLHGFYIQEMMREGVFTYNGIMLPSWAHDDKAFQQTVLAIDAVLERVQRADRNGTLHRDLELPLQKP
jgi:glutamate-1-semialdehyde 2,1-aminomutase